MGAKSNPAALAGFTSLSKLSMTVLSIFVKLNCSSSFLSDFRAVKSKLSSVNFFDNVVPMEVKYLLKLFAISLSSVSVIFSDVKLLGAFNPFDWFLPRCSLMTFQHLLESEVFSKKDSKYEVLDLIFLEFNV